MKMKKWSEKTDSKKKNPIQIGTSSFLDVSNEIHEFSDDLLPVIPPVFPISLIIFPSLYLSRQYWTKQHFSNVDEW